MSDPGSWKQSGWLWLGAAVPTVLAVQYAIEVGTDVFSLQGLGYSLGLRSADGLVHPGAVRFVTLVGLLELAVGCCVASDVRTTGGGVSGWFLWLDGHLSLLQGIAACVVWAVGFLPVPRLRRAVPGVGLPSVPELTSGESPYLDDDEPPAIAAA